MVLNRARVLGLIDGQRPRRGAASCDREFVPGSGHISSGGDRLKGGHAHQQEGAKQTGMQALMRELRNSGEDSSRAFFGACSEGEAGLCELAH